MSRPEAIPRFIKWAPWISITYAASAVIVYVVTYIAGGLVPIILSVILSAVSFIPFGMFLSEFLKRRSDFFRMWEVIKGRKLSELRKALDLGEEPGEESIEEKFGEMLRNGYDFLRKEKRLAVLGKIRSGKTEMLFTLVKKLSESQKLNYVLCLKPRAGQSLKDSLSHLNFVLSIPRPFCPIRGWWGRKTVVLILDDADRLSWETLKGIIRLMDYSVNEKKKLKACYMLASFPLSANRDKVSELFGGAVIELRQIVDREGFKRRIKEIIDGKLDEKGRLLLKILITLSHKLGMRQLPLDLVQHITRKLGWRHDEWEGALREVERILLYDPINDEGFRLDDELYEALYDYFGEKEIDRFFNQVIKYLDIRNLLHIAHVLITRGSKEELRRVIELIRGKLEKLRGRERLAAEAYLGVILMLLGEDLSEAVQYLGSAVDQLKKAGKGYRELCSLIYTWMGICNYRLIEAEGLNKLVEAEKCFRKALEIRSGDGRIEFNLGLLLAKTRKFREALPHLEAAINIKRLKVRALVASLVVKAILGDVEEANEILKKAEETSRTDEERELCKKAREVLKPA